MNKLIMAKIEGLRIKNFRALKDITLGQLWNKRDAKPLSHLTAVIGRNGVGKTTLFDVFGFLSDCLKYGVEDACDRNGRGGFTRIRTQGETEPIEFEIYYRENTKSRPITYELSIDLDSHKRPYVFKERLRQRRKGRSTGQPFSFLILENGKGVVWKGDQSGIAFNTDNQKKSDILTRIKKFIDDNEEESSKTEIIELSDTRKLGLATLGALKQHPRISMFREFIEKWYLSYFTPDAARSLPMAGPQKQLNLHGDNIGNVVQFMEREHPKKFSAILEKIAGKIPSIKTIHTEKTADGRLLLKFNDKGFKDPFYAQQMSDGTLKVFAYLLLLEDPTPPPFLCIEEPENGLYHKLLEILANEFREHATGHKNGSQIFVTTHQPYFVDALTPSEVWILEKGEDGFSTIRRASDDVLVNNLPKLLNAYGKTHQAYDNACGLYSVIVVCDLDDKDRLVFLEQLNKILNSCSVPPHTKFCLAIEEMEAWLLGDLEAIKKAYPLAKDALLKSYKNDTICGTWEILADALYKNGSRNLKQEAYSKIGTKKCEWAEKITEYMNPESNQSPSFQHFRNTLIELCV
ncbi:MAG: putative ATPase [Dasania sp.]